MNELWVKKTIWRRYLINDEDIEPAELTLKYDINGDELVADCFDVNEKVEYDDERVVKPVEYQITFFFP